MKRVETKLRAYVEPPQSILKQFDETSSLDHLYAKSIALYRRGELVTAITTIDNLIEMAPHDAFFHEFRGDILMSMAKPEAAAKAYQRAIFIRPDSPQILLNYGRALIASGRPTDLTNAISALEQTRDSEPKWAFVYRQLAIAYGRAGRLADADITLADEALIIGDTQQAINMAKRSLSHGTVRDEIKNHANDILYRYGALEK